VGSIACASSVGCVCSHVLYRSPTFPLPGHIPPILSNLPLGATYHALNLEEILRNILNSLYIAIRRKKYKRRGPDMSGAGLTCRAFCSVTLDIVWREARLEHLVQCMPKSLVQLNSGQIVSFLDLLSYRSKYLTSRKYS
jgi:hypothetical protein